MRSFAYAKINLTLDILGKREDGFHELKSVMIPVSLHDELDITESDDFEFSCNTEELSNSDNLCVKAAKAYFEKTGIKKAVKIYLKKEIPFAAGLGGGSSDAAGVLRTLENMYKSLGKKRLFDTALEIGSDVPFCLFGKSALCRGRGEEITPITLPYKQFFAVGIGKGRISARIAYNEYDLMKTENKNYTDRLIDALENKEKDLFSYYGNGFSEVVFRLCPESRKLVDIMNEMKAEKSMVSGSGPSVFGVFDTENSARNAVKLLKEKGYDAFYCESL